MKDINNFQVPQTTRHVDCLPGKKSHNCASQMLFGQENHHIVLTICCILIKYLRWHTQKLTFLNKNLIKSFSPNLFIKML